MTTAFQRSAFQDNAFQIDPAVVFDTHDGIDYGKPSRSHEDRERKEKQYRDDLTRTIRQAFENVTGEPEPAKPVTPKVEREIAREAVRVIRLEGLDEIQTNISSLRAKVRQYEADIAAQQQQRAADDNDALALLILVS